MANATRSAQTAASFLNGLGVDLHLDNSGTAYRQPRTRYGREYDRSNLSRTHSQPILPRGPLVHDVVSCGDNLRFC